MNAQWPPSADSMNVIFGLRKMRSRVSGRRRMKGSLTAWIISVGTAMRSTTFAAAARA